MRWIGLISLVFDIIIYIFMYFVICLVVCGGLYGVLGVDNVL